MTLVAATRLEARAARRARPGVAVRRSGIALHSIAPLPTPVAISVGLCGGLVIGVAPGTVVVPEAVASPEGVVTACDPEWSGALVRAATDLGCATIRGSLLTAPRMLTGDARAPWSARGFSAVDMETGLLLGLCDRLAAVRVVLDTPERELSPDWRHPARALLRPRLWGEGVWLARNAPRFARLAAVVAATALRADWAG